MSEHVIYDSESETADIDFHDEKGNLDKDLGRDMVVLADLGLWDGRHKAYKLVEDANLNQVLDQAQGDYYKVFVKDGEILADDTHHDGTNHYRFRLVREGKDAQELCDKLASQKDVSEDEIDEVTEPMGEFARRIYGWEA